MCLAVPGKIIRIDGSSCEIDIMGNRMLTDISLLKDAALGKYVLIHAGVAIAVISQEEAMDTIELLEEIVNG